MTTSPRNPSGFREVGGGGGVLYHRCLIYDLCDVTAGPSSYRAYVLITVF
jgi:hypothetical protein